ncbi:MAG: hypothetical protein AAFO62_10115 [Pseudomonadota bacterium]
MLTQILFIELVSKATIGGLLLLFPITSAKVFGLPHGNVGLWARLLGAHLIGIAIAVYLEHDNRMQGLGLGGLIVINVTVMLTLLSFAILKGAGTKRGAFTLYLLAFASFGLAVLEIAQI